MSTAVIKVENLSKKYILSHQQKGDYTNLRDVVAEKFRTAGRRVLHPFAGCRSAMADSSHEEFWALDDVSFEIGQGERVGIIGRNGAGKSTLLKILSRITEPTKGRVTIRGRVASLLEVGTGFHPELTGRENIFLNGAILGMTRNEITRKFDEIVAFAEVARFLDTPVKHYSSGMYVRLAFAVAAHLEPEILIVDEVLAVGDAAFQKKCLGKMEDVSAKEGRTVLFVSHNMGAIARLCRLAIWLDSGSIKNMGDAAEVVQNYQLQNISPCSIWTRPVESKDNDSFIFESIGISHQDNSAAPLFNADEPIDVTLSYMVKTDLSACQIGFRVFNADGVVVFTTADSDHTNVSAVPRASGSYSATVTIPANFFSPGTYSLSFTAHLPHRTVYETIDQPVTFTITANGWIGTYDGRLGVVSPVLDWNTTKQ